MLHTIFPIRIAQYHIANGILDRAICQHLESADWRTHEDQHEITTDTYTEDFMVGCQAFDHLVSEALKSYLNDLNYTQTHQATRTSWAVRYKQGQRTHSHDHGVSDVSCAYYHRLPGENSGIYFEDTGRQHTRLITHQLGDRHVITPKQGDLILFPGWLPHGSLPNTHKDYRIVISANFILNRSHLTR